jgi:hypothetical protein
MTKKLIVWSLGIGTALCVAGLGFNVAPAAARMAGYRLAADNTPGDKNHAIRADQYNETTRMLSGRAMVTIARVPPGETPKDQGAGP